jgi:hypothetical protein
LPYDPIKDAKTLELYGFQGGISSTDRITKQYVGYGSSCEDQDPVPCSIETRLNSTSGCFISCDSQEIFDNKTAFYLRSHPNLAWIPINLDSRESNFLHKLIEIPGLIKMTGGAWPFLFGRIVYLGNYQIGKVYAGAGRIGLDPNIANGRSNFEVLTCASQVLNDKPCGKFVIPETRKDL